MSVSSNEYTERSFKIDLSKRVIVNELIDTIREELNQSYIDKYVCKDGTVIGTDVGYVEDWFCVYADVLRKKYNIK